MTTIYDLSTRCETILKKYEKYDAPMKEKGSKSQDAFQEELEAVETEVQNLMEAASEVALETNRAVAASKNAEIRRAKGILLTDAIEALQKKVKKGKGLNKQIIAERNEKIKEVIDKIYAVPDGMSIAPTRRPQKYGEGKKGSKANPVFINTEGASGGMHSNPLYYQHTEQTQAFEKEWEASKVKQDQQLGRIEVGVDELGDMARNIGEELDRQNPVIDDIENQINKVTDKLKTNNQKLEGLVHKMRSSRNFCVDVILISILLAIGAYIYTIFK